MEFEEGDIVLCTVEKIEGTIVFVRIDETGEQGSIITSEIAPGRIRNLRDYVVPKKKIVCKILKIDKNNIYLSLRRVSQKERKEVIDEFQNERKLRSILKTILKEKTEEIIEKIKKSDSLSEFLKQSKISSDELIKLVGKENAEKILAILNSQKQKKSIIKKEFSLKTTSSNGINLIKEILKSDKADIRYIGAGKYSIKIESSDLKKADTEIQEIFKEIEHKSKENNLEFNIK
jgi:translation initiation factor 2 subunit 1